MTPTGQEKRGVLGHLAGKGILILIILNVILFVSIGLFHVMHSLCIVCVTYGTIPPRHLIACIETTELFTTNNIIILKKLGLFLIKSFERRNAVVNNQTY